MTVTYNGHEFGELVSMLIILATVYPWFVGVLSIFHRTVDFLRGIFKK